MNWLTWKKKTHLFHCLVFLIRAIRGPYRRHAKKPEKICQNCRNDWLKFGEGELSASLCQSFSLVSRLQSVRPWSDGDSQGMNTIHATYSKRHRLIPLWPGWAWHPASTLACKKIIPDPVDETCSGLPGVFAGVTGVYSGWSPLFPLNRGSQPMVEGIFTRQSGDRKAMNEQTHSLKK